MPSFKEIWGKLVHPAKKEQPKLSYSQLVNIIGEAFSSDERAEMNTTFVSGVNAHSDFFSEILPTCYFNGMPDPIRSGTNEILKLRPNAIDTAPRLYKRTCDSFYKKNYSFTWIQRSPLDLRTPVALWPMDVDGPASGVGKGPDGKWWFEFAINGQPQWCSSDDVLILVRECSLKDLVGGRSKALDKIIGVIDTSYTGLDKAIKQSIILRFIVQGATVYNGDDRALNEAEFNKILGGDNAAAYISAGDKVTEVQSQGKWPLSPEVQNLEAKVNHFLGITNNIMDGDFTEAQWGSYFSRSQKPLIRQLEAEMTAKLFTKDEYYKGNEIVIVTDYMDTVSADTRFKKAEMKLKMPVVVTNDVRKDMGEPPIEGGDKPQANLNWVGAANQDKYQGGSKPTPSEPANGQGGQTDGGTTK